MAPANKVRDVQLSDLTLVPQVGNTSRVTGIAVAPGGEFALTLAGKVKLWDLRTRKEVRTFSQAAGMAAMVLVPDGKSMIVSPVASGASTRQNPGDTILRQYDLASGKVVREFAGHTWPGASLAVNSSGSHLLSCIDKSARLWNLRDGSLAAILPVETGGRSLAVNREGNVLAISTYKDGLVQLWDVPGKRIIAMLPAGNQDSRLVEPEKLGFSDDGRLVFGYSRWYNQTVQVYDNVLYVWDVASGKLRTQTVLKASSVKNQNFVDYDPLLKRFFVVKDSGRQIEVYDPVSDKTEQSLTSKLVHDETAFTRVSAAGLLPGGLGVVLSTSEGNSLWGHVLNTIDFQVPELVNPVHPSLDIYTTLFESPDRRYVLAWDGDQANIAIWNLETGRLDGRMTMPGTAPASHVLSADRQWLYLASANTLFKWDVAKRHIAETWKLECTPLKMVASGNDILCFAWIKQYGSGEYVVFRLDGRNGKVLARSSRGYYSGDALALSPDGTRLAFAAGFKMPVFDSKTLELINEVNLGTDYAFNPAFLADNVTVLAGLRNQFQLINTTTGSIGRSSYTFSGITSVSARGEFFREIRYPDLNDRNRLTVHFRRVSDGQELDRAKLPADDALLAPYLYTAAGRNGIIRRNLLNSNQITCISDLDTSNWVVYDHRGYWDGSPQGGELLAMARGSGGTDSFQIDQFAVRNNRPDKVLESLDSTKTELKAHYQNAYQKRLKKLGMDEAVLESRLKVPGAELWGQVRETGVVQLGMRFNSPDARLVKYYVFVNNVPLFGATGRDFASVPASDIQFSENLVTLLQDIPLNVGTNKIEFSCTNALGIESFRYPVYAFQSAPSANPDLYFLGFGVSDYADPAIRDLKYAEKDVLDLEKTFKALQAKRFGTVYSKTVLGRSVTRQSITDAREFLKTARVDDTLVLFISGHGIQSGSGPVYYYVTGDTILSDLEATAAPFALIEDLLQGIAPRNKLFLMDTCESGEADEAALSLPVAGGTKGLYARTLGETVTRGLGVPGRQVSQALAERDRYIYNDLQRRSGTIVFSSSRGNEASLESDSLRQGLFTHVVMQALNGKSSADSDRNGVVTVRELRRFVEAEVPRLAASIMPGALQHPVVDRDNLYLDFGF